MKAFGFSISANLPKDVEKNRKGGMTDDENFE